VRFELTYKALAPHLPVIAPWREWDILSREDAIAYAAKHNVPIAQSTKKIYSHDRNIWHISHEGGRSKSSQRRSGRRLDADEESAAGSQQIYRRDYRIREGPSGIR
jgi:argininosuccinate synthase